MRYECTGLVKINLSLERKIKTCIMGPCSVRISLIGFYVFKKIHFALGLRTHGI